MYSDLPYYFIKDYLEKQYNKSLDFQIKNKLLIDLGANYTTYNPLDYYSKKKNSALRNRSLFQKRYSKGGCS